MTGVLIRFLALWFVAAFAVSALYSFARNRRIETACYVIATASVFVMAART